MTTPSSSSGQMAGVFDSQEMRSDERAYLLELTTYSMQRLEKEPSYLNTQKNELQDDIEQLAVKNYRMFLSTATTIEDARNTIHSMDTHTSTLLDSLPRVVDACDHFANETQAIQEDRRHNRVLAEHHTQLVELLEMPQLMSTCFRRALYDEALDLEEYARALCKRYPDISILNDLVSEMSQISERILKSLLQQFESEITLPKCLASVGLLRRMQVFDESRLRVEFLERRQVWLNSQLGSVSDEQISKMSTLDAREYLGTFLSVSRKVVFEVVTHYRAIFAEQAESGAPNPLSRWTSNWVTRLLAELSRILPHISEGSALASVLEDSMYCGLSMGRVGVDFRGLLPPLFETRAFDLFDHQMSQAAAAFSRDLDTRDWHITADVLRKLGILVEDASLDESIDNMENILASKQADVSAPQGLLEFPPLALLTNGFVNAFNELSQCAPASIQSRVLEVCRHTVKHVSSTLRSNFEQLEKADDDDGTEEDGRKAILLKLCQAAVDQLLPFFCGLFNRIYEISHGSTSSTLSLEELVKHFDGLYTEEDTTMDLEPKHFMENNEVHMQSDAEEDGGGAEQDNGTRPHTPAQNDAIVQQ